MSLRASVGDAVGAGPSGLSAFVPDEIDEGVLPVTCELAPHAYGDDCRTVDVGGRVYRYVLLGDRSGEEVVMVDFGGPGEASLASGALIEVVASSLPQRMEGRSILLVEEPWVTAAQPEKCWESGSEYVQYVLGHSAEAAELVRQCGLGQGRYGWDDETYDSVVDAILREHSLELDGFVAVSFGSVRLSYLSRNRPAWAVVHSPFHDEVSTERTIQHQLDGLRPPDGSFGGLNAFESASVRMGPVGETDRRGPS